MERREAALPDPRARSFFRSLVAGTLRHRGRLDHLLGGWLTGRGLEELPPAIRGALRLGAAQLLVLDGVPPHAAVHETVALAGRHGHRGTTGLVNAVLRRAAREGRAAWAEIDRQAAPTVESLALRYSHPEWLVRRWLARWGAERAEAVLRWDNQQPDYWVRLRPERGSGPGDAPSGSAAAPPGSVPGWVPGTVRLPAGARPAELPGFAEGRWTVQDGSGILVGLLCAPVRGLVIDLCAAPGTKTGHLAERAEPGARVLAVDLSPGRLRRLRRGLARLGGPEAGRVHVVAADSGRLPVRRPWSGALLDAPCSNLGVLRRRLDARWRAREEEIPRLAAVQARLLDAAAEGGAPGSWLVYSVCTTEPEEGELQRDRFFGNHPDWEPAEIPEAVPPGARLRTGEMLLAPGAWETDGGYAFRARRRGGET